MFAHAILRPGKRQSTLNSIAILSPRNTAICTLILASFRRLLRQEGAFLHQNKADAKPCNWWIQQLHLEVAKDAHLELNVPFPKVQQSNPVCAVDISKLDLQRVLPFTYDTLHTPPMVTVATQALFGKDERLIFKRFGKICLLSKQISMKTSLWDFSSL